MMKLNHGEILIWALLLVGFGAFLEARLHLIETNPPAIEHTPKSLELTLNTSRSVHKLTCVDSDDMSTCKLDGVEIPSEKKQEFTLKQIQEEIQRRKRIGTWKASEGK